MAIFMPGDGIRHEGVSQLLVLKSEFLFRWHRRTSAITKFKIPIIFGIIFLSYLLGGLVDQILRFLVESNSLAPSLV